MPAVGFVYAPGHTADIDQIERADVVGRGASAHRAAPQGHRGEQAGCCADAAQGGGAVDDEPRHRHAQGKAANDGFIFGVHGKGVAAALVAQYLADLFQHGIFVRLDEKCEDRTQLFARVGTGGAGFGFSGDQHGRGARHVG